ncbi:hypothetical protein J2755_001266 [Methanohalophilus levihalophilus]|uniref:hypothetical protein n=1 Tax=Methanohalophilus levihalophilus TaxID=1431282 RepID=UPI001AE1126F|nr:hypothetical protein [Methanohalophilus levihalophilus]MBP2030332.1 hypothetical protein [Methanohalophilus levihalophilus]
MILLGTDQIVDVALDKLKTGWAVLYGHPDVFKFVEYSLYKPGTNANAGFELLGFLPTVAFCKKTPGFRKMFKETDDRTVTVLQAFKVDNSEGFAFHILEAPKDSDNEARYNKVAQAVRNYLVNGEFVPHR